MSKILLLCLLMVLGACRTSPKADYSQRPHPLDVKGPFTHAGSGFVLPASEADFQRIGITQYDAKGLDIGAGYEDPTRKHPIELTVYVYPGERMTSVGSPPEVIRETRLQLCKSSYQRAAHEITGVHKDATLEKETTSSVKIFGEKVILYKAYYKFNEQKLNSILALYCPYKNDWLVKIRATFWPAFAGDEAEEAFVSGILKQNGYTP